MDTATYYKYLWGPRIFVGWWWAAMKTPTDQPGSCRRKAVTHFWNFFVFFSYRRGEFFFSLTQVNGIRKMINPDGGCRAFSSGSVVCWGEAPGCVPHLWGPRRPSGFDSMPAVCDYAPFPHVKAPCRKMGALMKRPIFHKETGFCHQR